MAALGSGMKLAHAIYGDILGQRLIKLETAKRNLSTSSHHPSPPRLCSNRRRSRHSPLKPLALPSSPREEQVVSTRLVRGEMFADCRAAATPALPQAEVDAAAAFNPAAIREFTPQNFDLASTNGASPDSGLQSYDPFTMSSMGQALPAAQFNPYANDHNHMAAGHGSAYYQGQAGYAAPLQPVSSCP